MKKSGSVLLILSLLILNIFSAVLIHAQEETPKTPLLPGAAGGINEETGLPKSFDKFQEASEQLSKEEQRKEYINQEWTKLWADNKFLAPVLFYTNKFFSFFNPLWSIIFGVEFSWSWFFILSLLIWAAIIILIYSPVKSLTNLGPVVTLIFSAVISSIMGWLGEIRKFVDFLAAIMSNKWVVWTAIIIAILLIILYYKLFKKYGKNFKERTAREQQERDRAILHAEARATREVLNK